MTAGSQRPPAIEPGLADHTRLLAALRASDRVALGLTAASGCGVRALRSDLGIPRGVVYICTFAPAPGGAACGDDGVKTA